MAVTILPFISLFTTALHPSGSIPLGIEWPADPQWGNFVKAFNQASMGTLLVSSLTIVLGVVPIALMISTMAGFAIGHLRIPGDRLLLLLFIFGLTLPFEAVITPIYYIVRNLGHPQHAARDHPAADRPVHAVRGVLDARALREHAERAVRGRPRRRGRHVGPVLADPRARSPGRPSCRSGSSCPSGRGTSSSSPSILVDDPKQRTVAGALGAFQGQWATDIPLLCAGSILILLPTLIVFVIFQRQVIAALLQGSVKG